MGDMCSPGLKLSRLGGVGPGKPGRISPRTKKKGRKNSWSTFHWIAWTQGPQHLQSSTALPGFLYRYSLPPSRFILDPAVCVAKATSFKSSWNWAFLATKSVSQLSSTIEAQLPLTMTPIRPCAVFRPSSLLALSKPSSNA